MKQRRTGKHLGRRALALFMAVVFALSGMGLDGFKVVKAAETGSVTDTVTVGDVSSSKPIYVKFTKKTTIPADKWGPGSPSQELSEYNLTIVNNSDTDISDWELTISCNNISVWNAGWNGVSRSGNKITAGTCKTTDDKGNVWDNMTVAAGNSAGGPGFQVDSNALNGASYTLTYKLGASSGTPSQDDTQTDPGQIGSTSSKVTATFKQSNVAGAYHEYFLQVKNGLSESISDWVVAIPMSGVTGSENWASQGWAKVQAYYTSEYLYVSPVGGAVISAGATFGSDTDGAYKFNYKGNSNIDASSAVVYYKTGTASTGAFDAVIGNATVDGGSGSGGTGGSGGAQTDTTTDLNLDIEYNFAKLLQESLYFYDANMCGEIEDVCGLSWRGNCHLGDKKVTYDGKTYDVSGGFHDAGDHVKFGLPQGYSSSVLAMGYYEFGEAYDELGQTEHYQAIMDHFCDYYTRSTIYDGSTVKAFCYQVGDGDADHAYWGAPETQTSNRPAWFADASNPATDEVSVAITTLAVHALNFKDSAKSAGYLKTAKDLFAFVQKNKKEVTYKGPIGSMDFYRSTDWKDDYASAAIALYKATNDESYLNEFKSYYTSGNIKTGWVLTWDNMWAVASMLYEDWNTVSQFASYPGNVINGYKIVDGWGSARYNTTLQFLGLSYDQANDKFTTASGNYCAWATGQMKYLLGNNDTKRCFVVGYNENSTKYPHHRAASRSNDAGSTREDHYTLLGALVGGPDGNGNYADDQADYNCNEVALDYNAGMVGAAAGLYLLHKGNTDFETQLAPESELESIGVTKYYGTEGGGGTTVPKTVLTDADITFPAATAITYGDTLAKATLSKTKDTYGTYAWESSTVKPDAGTHKYKVVYTPTNTKEYDYTGLTGYNATTKKVVREITVQVAKKKLGSVVFPTVTKSVPAGTLLKNIPLSFTKDDFGTFTWEKPDFAVTGSTTGANVVYRVSNSENVMVDTDINGASKDGSSVTRKVTVTVTKVTPAVTVPVSIPVVAGTKLSEISLSTGFSAVADGKTVPGIFAIKDADKVLTYEDNGGEITIVFTPTDTDGYKAVEKVTKVIVTKKNYESKPAAPVVSGKTANTVTLQALENVEYGWKAAGSSGNYKWEQDRTITGLTEYTAYEFALRYKATNIYHASEAGASVQTKTNYSLAACYAVDVSRLKEDGYVEAHDGKIAYDVKTGKLTLTDSDKAYTITGANADADISCGSAGTVILSDAVLRSIQSEQDITIKLVGSNTVKDGIAGDKTVTVQNGSQTSTAGKLTVTGGSTAAITADVIVIEGGQITATGSGEAAALKATTEIDLFGGSLTANAEVIPIQAPKIVLDGCQVKSDASPVYSTEPVDREGNPVNLCTVTYMDGDTELAVYSVKTGGDISLDNLVKKAGYKAMGWEVQGGDGTVYAQGAAVTVDASIVYVAQYEKVVGTVSMTAAEAEDLTAGYPYDTGIVVTIVNNTNVTLEEILVSLDEDTYFTWDKTSVQGVEPGGEAEVTVKLKNGLGVNTTGYTVTLLAVCDEVDIDALEIVRRVQKMKAPKPANAPNVADVTEDSITLAPESADGYTVEYGILKDGKYVWQTSNVFEDLKSYTTYTFAIRYGESEEALAGEAGPSVKGTTAMAEKDKYIVDLTKLGDKEYVDAHEDTLYMDNGELVLTGSGEYTITGSDEDLTIRATKDVTIYLEDASFEALDGNGDITLDLTGASEICSAKEGISGITSPGTVTIQSESDGSLAVRGGDNAPGIRADKIVIHGGTVTITGGSDNAGMKADVVTIDGGTVSVTGQGSAPAIDAKTKQITVLITETNGKDYKGSGEEDLKPSPSPTPTAAPTKEPGKNQTPKPKETAKPKPTRAPFVPALTTVNVLLKKGGSYKLSTNSGSVKIAKVAYANKKAKKIVKVNKAGKIKAKKTGKAKLNVALSYNGRTYTKQVTVKVQKNPVKILNKTTISIKLKRKQKCSLVNPANMLSASGMKFTSSKKKVAAVNKKGVVTGKKKGKAKITVRMNGKTYTVKVKVK